MAPLTLNRLYQNIPVALIYGTLGFSAFSNAAGGLMTALLSLLFITHVPIARDYRQLQTPLLWPVLFFAISVALSSLFSGSDGHVGSDLREFWRFLLPFALWRYGQSLNLSRVLKAWLIVLSLLAIYGIIQYYWGVDWFRAEGNKKVTPYLVDMQPTGVFHAKGNFSHHLTFAHYMLLVFPLFVAQLFSPAWPRMQRVLPLAGGGLMVLALFLSLGRSAWIGATVALAVQFLRLPRKWLWTLIGLGIALFLGLFLWISVSSSETNTTDFPLKTRLEHMFSLKYNQDRLLMWKTAVMGIQDHPWLGIGINQDGRVMPSYREHVKKEHGYLKFYNKAEAGVHNIYLQIWLNLGTVGFAIYLWFWGTIFFILISSIRLATAEQAVEKDLLWGMLSAFSGFLAAGTFENSFLDGEVQTVLMALLGLLLLVSQRIRERTI